MRDRPVLRLPAGRRHRAVGGLQRDRRQRLAASPVAVNRAQFPQALHPGSPG